ncbi:uroporphyrinogen-III synthase [Dokdonia sinensis]|uniref:Uroporphyrinogen-III synthase n=1 Tax=Dokdonia sinensis TaxID=2479847 RepID=A0A3M0FZA5_9FLAO|nr:uroporphyrinogen-III synthase [Dokdonia sinensis]
MRLLSTKKLKLNQRELLLNAEVSFVEYDAITIAPLEFKFSALVDSVIITSQNGARAILNSGLRIENANFYCVGEKTSTLLVESGLNVAKTARNGEELATFIIENLKNEQFTYFCGKQRRDELPDILKEARIICNEVVVYETHLNEQRFEQEFDGILFFSPSGVSAFAKANHPSTTLRVQDKSSPQRSRRAVAICIGETTAKEARKHFETVVVSNATTIESTIARAVKYLATGY